MKKDWKAVSLKYKSCQGGKIVNNFFLFLFLNFSNRLINYQIQNTKLISSQSYICTISNFTMSTNISLGEVGASGWGVPGEQGCAGGRGPPPLSWPPSLAVRARLLGWFSGWFRPLCSLITTFPPRRGGKRALSSTRLAVQTGALVL